MSIKSQQNNMQAIYRLISQDLGYIYGERESGPSGVKKEFLSKSAAFLRALSKDLCFKEMKVTSNPAGIAVSGDVNLYGMWSENNGLFLQISQSVLQPHAFMYRHITSMKDYKGGNNLWLSCSLFAEKDYEKLLLTLGAIRKPSEEDKCVA